MNPLDPPGAPQVWPSEAPEAQFGFADVMADLSRLHMKGSLTDDDYSRAVKRLVAEQPTTSQPPGYDDQSHLTELGGDSTWGPLFGTVLLSPLVGLPWAIWRLARGYGDHREWVAVWLSVAWLLVIVVLVQAP